MAFTRRSPWTLPAIEDGVPSRRAVTTVIATLALLLAGLLPVTVAHAGAAAAQTSGDTISGRVNLPADVPGRSVEVNVWEWAHWPGLSPGWHENVANVRVADDGTFSVTGLAQKDYRLEVSLWPAGDFNHVGGFYAGQGKTLAREAEDGISVRPGTSNLAIDLHQGGPITGRIHLPALAGSSSPHVYVMAYDITDLVRPEIGEISRWPWSLSGGSDRVSLKNEPQVLDFVVRGHRQDATLMVVVSADDGRVPRGYFHANGQGLVSDANHATLLKAGDDIDLFVGTSFVSPKLTPYVAPRLSGEAVVGEELVLEPGRWSLAGTSQKAQWLRNGTIVPGVTGDRYVLQEVDLGATITARVTVTKSGFGSASFDISTSGPVRAPAVPEDPEVPSPEDPEGPKPEDPDSDAAAPKATVAPVVKGTARWGKSLRATPGTWDAKDVQLAYQWLRGGKAIKGATSARYKLKKKDIGKRIAVRVTASLAGAPSGQATSKSKKVAKAKPKVTAKVKNVTRGMRATVEVRVKAAGLAKPTGTLTVRYGKKTVKIKLVAKRKGKVSLRLPELRKGTHRVRVTYTPSGSSKKVLTKATSKRVTLRVR